MIDVLTHYSEKDYVLHAYVIMPDHLHLLITPSQTLEKSVQLIKGGFSFRAKRELNWKFDIWQPGFTDHRIREEEDWKGHLEYIRTNPVEARLIENPVLYKFMGFPNIAFPQRLKPRGSGAGNVRAEARTLHRESTHGTTEVVPFQNERDSHGTIKAVPFQNGDDAARGMTGVVPLQSKHTGI